MIVKGETFSAAWLAAAAVSTNDKDFPKYSNTFKLSISGAFLSVEAVATELGAWIFSEISFDNSLGSDSTIIVMDQDARVTNLMKWVYAKTHGKDAVPIDVHLDVEVDDEAIPGLGGQRLHVSVPRQSYWPNEQTWDANTDAISTRDAVVYASDGTYIAQFDVRYLAKIVDVDGWRTPARGVYDGAGKRALTLWRHSEVHNIVSRDAKGIAEKSEPTLLDVLVTHTLETNPEALVKIVKDTAGV